MPTQMAPNLDDVLRVLNLATENNGLHWSSTAEEDTFRAEFGGWMVRVSKNSTQPLYCLSLLDSDGQLLDEFQPSGEGQTLAIESLYKKARGQALNLDWKLKSFYDHLKQLAGET